MERVLLTGATGFIGSHVLEAFRREGIAARCLLRKEAGRGRLAADPESWCIGDIRDAKAVEAALEKCTSVVHCAALASDWGPRRAFEENNVHGTLNILRACAGRGIGRVIITGSISSYGEEHCSEAKDESWPFNPRYPYFLERLLPSGMNRYRWSKAEATRRAIVFADRNGIDLTVIEPVWVYGPREFYTGFYTYVRAVRDGAAFMPGSRHNLFHVVYAGDLARAYVAALRRRLPGVRRIIVGNARAESMNCIFSLFCREAGLKPPRLLPKWTIYPAGVIAEVWATLRRRMQAPLLTRSRVNMFYDTIVYSVDRARKVLGFEAEIDLETGIKRTVEWYRCNAYL